MIKEIISILRITWKLTKEIRIMDLEELYKSYYYNYEYQIVFKWLERITDKKEGFIIRINNLYILINEEIGFRCLSNGPIVLSHPFTTPFIIDSFECPLSFTSKPWEDVKPKEIMKDISRYKDIEKEIEETEREFNKSNYAKSYEDR